MKRRKMGLCRLLLLLLLLLLTLILPCVAPDSTPGFVARMWQRPPRDRDARPLQTDGFFLPLESTLYIQLGIGNPLRLVTFSLDSATLLTWLECPQRYDPKASSTYAPLPCAAAAAATSTTNSSDISFCSPPLFCTSSQFCGYDIIYDDVSSAGDVVSDTLHVFPSIYEPNVTLPLPGFLFGCGTSTRMPEEAYNGVDGRLSLTTHPLSLLSQLHISRFSHCLWPSPIHSHNYIRFGSMAQYDGESIGGVVQLLNVTGSSLYHIALLGFSVGPRLIDQEMISRRSLVVDIGTYFTRLEGDIYDLLKQEVLMQIGPTIGYEANGLMCFFHQDWMKMEMLPVITLQLEAFNYSISNKGVYERDGPAICAAFIRSSKNVLGASALVDYAVGYDTHDRKISFFQKDCLADFVDEL